MWLYRHRLGWILGQRVLLLAPTGRRGGFARHVCLEVVQRPTRDTIVIAGGFGRAAQRYRSLQADPSATSASDHTAACPPEHP